MLAAREPVRHRGIHVIVARQGGENTGTPSCLSQVEAFDGRVAGKPRRQLVL